MSPPDRIRTAFPKPETTLGSAVPIPEQRIASERSVAAWAPELPEADEAIAAIAAFIERRVAR